MSRLLIIALVFSASWCFAESATLKTSANVPLEITFTAAKPHSNPAHDAQLEVVFTEPGGGKKVVPAFWDGGAIWKVRYSSAHTGTHQWRTQCVDTTDTGLHGVEGKLQVSRYHGTNTLYQHGPIQVAADHRHFEHADGTPFLWLGDTWWMGLCHRLHFPGEFAQLTADRKAKGFNVVQIVAGLYPDMHPFDPRGANEAGFPWETNYARLRPEYFDAADQRIRYLIEQGFTPCIVGAWGYFLPWMGEEKAKEHWRELIARYGSWPVVWCIAGEANLPWYLAKGFPYDDRELVHGWTAVTRYVRATDPFHRPTTIHPTGIGKLNARWAIDDASLLDFDMLQTPHGQADAVAPTVAAFKYAYDLPPAMPILDGEASYEMLNGTIGAEWSRAMFWLCMINGAPGHTYGANGIWQCNRREQPHGASPHGGNYGTIPWDDSMRLPGSQQIGNGKKFLQNFPWQRCVPQSETVQWTGTTTGISGNWIWYPEGDARVDAPLETRYFRREFNISTGNKGRVVVRVAADDKATVWLNGKKIGEATDWRTPHEFDITSIVQNGRNVLAIAAENLPAPVKQNPAGLIATIEMTGRETIASDSNWRASRQASSGWMNLDFKDADWQEAKIVAKYGEGPWGNIGQENSSFVPYAIGIKDELRIVYAISPRGLEVTHLRPNGHYLLTTFDPVTGETKKQKIRASTSGAFQHTAPAHGHDFVLALEVKR